MSLGKSIKQMIINYEGPFYAIGINDEISCTCRASSTKEPNSHCPLCLGTGHQIHIRMVKGVVQESNSASTMKKNIDYTITKEIFMRPEFYIDVEDIIVFNDEPLDVYQIKSHRLENNELIYRICYCTPKKYDTAIFMKNFKAIVGE